VWLPARRSAPAYGRCQQAQGAGARDGLKEHAVGFGQVEGVLQGALGCGRVAERVPGDRLQQERLNPQGGSGYLSGAVQDRRE
jgi:hypothetical protein